MSKLEYPVACKICGNEYNKQLTNSHLKRHDMTTTEYKEKFGEYSLSNQEYRQLLSESRSGSKNSNFGRKHTQETKDKISNSNKGNVSFWKGKTLPDEMVEKMSETKRKKYQSGETVAWNKGGTMTREVRDKISKSVKQYAAENNEELSKRALKARETLRERYGEEYLDDRQKNMIAAITPDGKERQKNSLIEQNKNKKQNAKIKLFNKLKSIGYEVLEYDEISKRISYICDNGVEHNNHRQYFDECRNEMDTCKMCIPKSISQEELRLREYIYSLVGNEMTFSDRSVLSPKEIDILVRSRGVAVEYDGLYYHSFEFGKDKLFHSDKTLGCRALGIDLIHVFEDEWIHKKDIVKAIIRNKLGIIGKRIFARKCVVKPINAPDARNFIDEHHIYGYKNASVKYGLFYDGELVSVMTFSKGNHSRKQYGWEIDRFATKFDTQVIGGASKLFKHFLREYDPDTVVSYADLRYGEGKVYSNLGFELDSVTPPSYYYFKPVANPTRIHRYALRKTVEENKTGKTELELRSEQGYYRIYDCGHNKWIWKK